MIPVIPRITALEAAMMGRRGDHASFFYHSTAAHTIDRVDRALLAAKAAGRNRVVVWDPSMIEAAPSIIADSPIGNSSAPSTEPNSTAQ
jgi:hypothetical protein